MFRTVANERNLTIAATATLPTDASDTARINKAAQVAANVIWIKDEKGANIVGDVGTIVYLGSASDIFQLLLIEAEKYNITGNPFIWLASDGGNTFCSFFFFSDRSQHKNAATATSFDFRNDNVTKPSTRLGIYATTGDDPFYSLSSLLLCTLSVPESFCAHNASVSFPTSQRYKDTMLAAWLERAKVGPFVNLGDATHLVVPRLSVCSLLNESSFTTKTSRGPRR